VYLFNQLIHFESNIAEIKLNSNIAEI